MKPQSFVLGGWLNRVSSLLGLTSIEQRVQTKQRVMAATSSLFAIFLIDFCVFPNVEQVKHEVVGLCSFQVVVNTTHVYMYK